MKHAFAKCVLLALAALLFAGIAIGQAGQTYGRLEGTVKDQTGGAIPGVTVTIISVGVSKNVVSGDSGDYNFQFLNPGKYDVKAELQGFKTFEQKGVDVRLGAMTRIDVVLQTGEISDVVTVTDTAPLIDTTSTTVGASLSEGLYQSIPTRRNFTALLNLAPGVGDGGGTGAANPSIGGASGLENNVVVDGVNITNPGFGGMGTYSQVYGSLGTGVNFDFVKEVQVKSGGFEAEYGQSTGGVVNVITKSGGNEYHGGIYFYGQPEGFQAAREFINKFRQAQATETITVRQYDLSADFSGYLFKDKLFFYLGFNPQYLTNFNIAPSDSPQWRTSRGGVYGQKDSIYSWSGKLTYIMHPNHNLEFSTTADPSERSSGPNRTMTGDADLKDSRMVFGSWNFIGRYNGVLTNNWFLTASLGRSYNRFTESAAQPNEVAWNDWTQATRPARGGLGFIQNNESRNWQFNIKSTWNVRAGGDHQIDVGYTMEDVKYDGINVYTGPLLTIPADARIGFTGGSTHGAAGRLRTVSGFAKPLYQQIRGNENDPGVFTTTKYHSFFVQDAWKIGKHFTFKPGLRYDYQKMAGEITGYTFSGNWAPRIGAIYDVMGDGKTKLFVNWGRFYEKIPNDIAVRSFSSEKSFSTIWWDADVLPSGSLRLNRVLNGDRGIPISRLGGDITPIIEGTKTMYQDEWVFGFERQLTPSMGLSIRYIQRRLGRILEDIGSTTASQYFDLDAYYIIANPSATTDVVNNVTCELGGDGIPDGYPDAVRDYKALEISLEKRFANNFQFLINYRLAKVWGNYEGLFRNDNGQNDPNISSLFDFRDSTDPTDINPDTGLPWLGYQYVPGYLNTDRRHTINMNGSYTFDWKLTLGIGARFASGRPLVPLQSHPDYLNQGEIPLLPRGDAGRTAWINNIDMHADYPFTFGNYRLRLAVDLFNVLNTKKAINFDEFVDLGSPGAGLPPPTNPDYFTAIQFQRSFNARFSVRFEF